MTGDADDLVEAQNPARVLVGGVFLADMNAVGVQSQRQIGPVIDDEGHAALLRDGAEAAAHFEHLVVGHILQAQLQAGDVARVQSGDQGLFEFRQIGDGRRRNGVKPANGLIVHSDFAPLT